jgi:hypothetical protein
MGSRKKKAPAAIQDRIVELIRVPASDLAPNEKNWRRHPPEQRAALRGLLEEVGFADALLARRDADGQLVLIDGHLRQEEMPEDAELPVLVLDVTEEEADKILLTLDPLAAMAEPDPDAVSALMKTVASSSAGVQALLASLPKPSKQRKMSNPVWGHRYEVVVACKDEAEQEQVYERLSEEGFTCRVLTL